MGVNASDFDARAVAEAIVKQETRLMLGYAPSSGAAYLPALTDTIEAELRKACEAGRAEVEDTVAGALKRARESILATARESTDDLERVLLESNARTIQDVIDMVAALPIARAMLGARGEKP